MLALFLRALSRKLIENDVWVTLHMTSRIEMTEGRARLEAIIASRPPASADWNEAENRFQFIDRLLIECLGWQQPSISVERRDEAGGKADYLLGRPARAVLEAKREARLFDLLPGTRPNAIRKLRPLFESCKIIEATTTQVIAYCAMNGAKLAAICNGPQMILFQASIDGLSPIDGDCFVFNGFQEYLSDFQMLWRLLSPDGIADNRAYRALSAHRNPRIPTKASTKISDPMQLRYRSELQEELRELSELLLEDIERNSSTKADFYRECYVQTSANNRHFLQSKNIINARYRRISDNGTVSASDAAWASTGRLELDDTVRLTVHGARPIVVIGDVGVGKTSFFENLYQQLSTDQQKITCFIHLDLGENANLTDVKSYVVEQLPAYLRKEYGINIYSVSFLEKVYKNDIIVFDESVEARCKQSDPTRYQDAVDAFLLSKSKDAGSHLKRSMEYVQLSLGKQIIIILDNTDQRSFKTQQEAFLIAQELASYKSTLVFVALRPSTFYLSKLTGALSGYQNRVLTISPPPADEVLRRRITFAVRVAEGKAAPAALENVRFNLRSIILFLTASLRSIRGNASIKTFIGNVTGGNIKSIIELFTSFCGSANVESERIVRIEEETGDYLVPLHEFTKHALLGEYAYFNQLSSTVAFNLFDITTPSPREHFLCALLIAYISSPMGIKDNDGFVIGNAVFTEMARLGFDIEQVRYALQRLASKKLIETPHSHYREIAVKDDDLPDEFHFRATSSGLYHVRQWISSFSFLDAMAIDTPIFDDFYRGIIFEKASSFAIEDRYAKAVGFRRYLQQVWLEANFQENYFDFVAVITSDETFVAVERFLHDGPLRRRNASGLSKRSSSKRGRTRRKNEAKSGRNA